MFRIKPEIDEQELLEILRPVLENPESTSPQIDRGWKNFDYRKFVGLEWEPETPCDSAE